MGGKAKKRPPVPQDVDALNAEMIHLCREQTNRHPVSRAIPFLDDAVEFCVTMALEADALRAHAGRLEARCAKLESRLMGVELAMKRQP